MPLVLQDKTEVYSFLTEDNVLYEVRLTYVYACPKRHGIESMVEGRNYHVTGLHWIPNASHMPIEVDDYEELVEVCNEFMLAKFQIEDCYNEYDFGYENDEQEDEHEDVVDHEKGHYL